MSLLELLSRETVQIGIVVCLAMALHFYYIRQRLGHLEGSVLDSSSATFRVPNADAEE